MPMEPKPIIYQLVVRYFGNTNTTNRPAASLAENGCGKFNDINDAALRSLSEMGVTHIWLTGVLRQATLTDYSHLGLPPDDPDVVKGVAGSFYAVRDYFDVCPDYAVDLTQRMSEFKALVQRVHAHGMKVLIDFVPNHVARGYHSVIRPDLDFGLGDDRTQFFSPSNHFFYVVNRGHEPLRLSRPEHWNPPEYIFDGLYPPEDGSADRPVKVTGNNCVEITLSPEPWYETVKLNYGFNFVDGSRHYDPQPRLWGLMDQILAYWQALGVDGFRCDFAHFIPPEAWTFLITRAKQRDPNVYFMAEAYPWEGSGDPITSRQQLIEAGMAAVYNDASYDALKRIYLGRGSQDDYHYAMVCLTPEARRGMVQYVENHDERRIASPLDYNAGWTGNSGFGSAEAGYLIAPLQYLCGPGPVLMLNGQEIGEPAADAEGYSGRDGRSTVFDYWCMPEFVKWVNGHEYDGEFLSAWQIKLRNFYSGLLSLCQDPTIRSNGYWGLKYINRPDVHADCPESLYSFARFAEGAGQLLIVVGNFDRQHDAQGRLRVPPELAEHCQLGREVEITLRLDRNGLQNQIVTRLSSEQLIADGFSVSVPAETATVYQARTIDSSADSNPS